MSFINGGTLPFGFWSDSEVQKSGARTESYATFPLAIGRIPTWFSENEAMPFKKKKKSPHFESVKVVDWMDSDIVRRKRGNAL
jgi:hypothetical protein